LKKNKILVTLFSLSCVLTSKRRGKMNIGSDKITQLIGDYIEGVLSDDDIKILEEWLKAPTNQRLFERLTNKSHIVAKDLQYQTFNKDIDAAWNATQQKVKQRKSLTTWWQYAAAVLIPLVLFFTVYQLSNIEIDKQDITSQTIEPGEHRAILILSDGSQVEVATADTLIRQTESGIAIRLDSMGVNYQGIDKKLVSETRFNTMNTSKGMEYSLILEDGTKVWLNSESSLRFPERFVDKKREVFAEGEVYFEVAKEQKRPFYVHFNNKKIEVLGTQFNVRSYKEEKNDFVTLTEGSIALNSKQANVIMEPNKQAIVNKATGEMQVKSVNAMVYGAWRNGNFVYDKARLETIINDMARWYKVNVFYQNPSVKDLRLSLYSKRQGSITELLEILEVTEDIAFELNDDNLIVRTKQ